MQEGLHIMRKGKGKQTNKTDGLKDAEKIRNKFIQTFQKVERQETRVNRLYFKNYSSRIVLSKSTKISKVFFVRLFSFLSFFLSFYFFFTVVSFKFLDSKMACPFKNQLKMTINYCKSKVYKLIRKQNKN